MVGVVINGAIDAAEVLDHVVADLDVLVDRFDDLTPLMEAIGQYGVTSTKDRFNTNIDPSGDPWAPSERSELTGGKIQVERGHLRDSMSYNVLGETGVEWGSNLIYAAQRQFGGSIRAVNAPFLRWQGPGGDWHSALEVFQPPRPFLGISLEDEDEIGEIVGLVMEEAFA
jgi:phage gpG-like protein